MLKKALKIAYKAHKGQFRKHSSLPYIIHPLEVAKQLIYWGIPVKDNEEMFCAAILHDTLEDGKDENKLETRIREISFNTFMMVRELTHKPFVESKDEYLKGFKNSNKVTFVESLVIKLADRYSNIIDFELANNGYSAKYTEKGRPLFEALLNRSSEIDNKFSKSSRVYENIYSDYSKLFT